MFISNGDFSILHGRSLFIDSDFLGFLFEDPDNLEQTLTFFPKSFLTIDPLVEFEFLRDVFLPEQRDNKEQFVSTEEIFLPAISHHEIFNKIRLNALLLSKMYAHKNLGNKNGGWSSIDLLLAGRLMMYWKNSAIITGNKRDFPSIVFDTLGIISYENSFNQIRSFAILLFNHEKYQKCISDLEKLEKTNR